MSLFPFLRIGSVLVYHRFPWEEPYAPYKLEVLYEDDDVVRGLLCHLVLVEVVLRLNRNRRVLNNNLKPPPFSVFFRINR